MRFGSACSRRAFHQRMVAKARGAREPWDTPPMWQGGRGLRDGGGGDGGGESAGDRGAAGGGVRASRLAAAWREVPRGFVVTVVLAAIALLVAARFVMEGPPRHLTLAAGPPGSRFETVARAYEKALARAGVTVTVVNTAGSVENLSRLAARGSAVDVAFVQAGTADSAGVDTSNLTSLGSIFYQPLTIFYRADRPISRLSQLAGQRIAIGPPGSGTRALALVLLKANEIVEGGPTRLVDLEGEAARKALLAQRVDAIFMSGDSASPTTIREMLHAPGIQLFEFSQADAYVRRFRYLSRLDLPAGVFDLGENLPAAPVTLLAPTVELVARSTLHPALSDLLLDAAGQVNGGATLLQSAGEFPTDRLHDLPISADAARYYKSGKSLAYRHLPFWLASLVDRMVVLVVPILLVVIPALRYLPEIYNWYLKTRISRRYKQLMALERESLEELSAAQRRALLARLEHIEKSVIALRIPGSHADQVYVLRQHLNFVRENLARTEGH